MTNKGGRFEEFVLDKNNEPITCLLNSDYGLALGQTFVGISLGSVTNTNVVAISVVKNSLYRLQFWEATAVGASSSLLIHFVINDTAVDPTNLDPMVTASPLSNAGQVGKAFPIRTPDVENPFLRFKANTLVAGSIKYALLRYF